MMTAAAECECEHGSQGHHVVHVNSDKENYDVNSGGDVYAGHSHVLRAGNGEKGVRSSRTACESRSEYKTGSEIANEIECAISEYGLLQGSDAKRVGTLHYVHHSEGSSAQSTVQSAGAADCRPREHLSKHLDSNIESSSQKATCSLQSRDSTSSVCENIHGNFMQKDQQKRSGHDQQDSVSNPKIGSARKGFLEASSKGGSRRHDRDAARKHLFDDDDDEDDDDEGHGMVSSSRRASGGSVPGSRNQKESARLMSVSTDKSKGKGKGKGQGQAAEVRLSKSEGGDEHVVTAHVRSSRTVAGAEAQRTHGKEKDAVRKYLYDVDDDEEVHVPGRTRKKTVTEVCDGSSGRAHTCHDAGDLRRQKGMEMGRFEEHSDYENQTQRCHRGSVSNSDTESHVVSRCKDTTVRMRETSRKNSERRSHAFCGSDVGCQQPHGDQHGGCEVKRRNTSMAKSGDSIDDSGIMSRVACAWRRARVSKMLSRWASLTLKRGFQVSRDFSPCGCALGHLLCAHAFCSVVFIVMDALAASNAEMPVSSTMPILKPEACNTHKHVAVCKIQLTRSLAAIQLALHCGSRYVQ